MKDYQLITLKAPSTSYLVLNSWNTNFNRDKIAKLDPSDELRFQVTPEQQMKCYLSIENISQGNIALKIKTTAPRNYVVKPNQAILDMNAKIMIDITLQPNKPGQSLDQFLAEEKVEENKFLIEIALCPLSSSEIYNFASFWDKLEKSQKISNKLKVSVHLNKNLL